MALVKCKECGEQISTKAKNCPKCGAAAPKKTSMFTWFVLVSIIAVIYVSTQSTTSNNTSTSPVSKSSIAPKEIENAKKEPPPKPSWSTSTSKDEMTGKLSAYASSPIAFPTKKMSFPYSNVNAWLGVGCDSSSEWVYIGFNGSPNLAKTETEDGYNIINTRIKWNDSIENVELTQEWSAEFLHFRNDAPALAKILSSNIALLELQWHGQQATYFEFSLNGSSKAISEIKKKCGR
jgi:RNA polymerase subunit RPABC4/transcription elongation factor Spt4